MHFSIRYSGCKQFVTNHTNSHLLGAGCQLLGCQILHCITGVVRSHLHWIHILDQSQLCGCEAFPSPIMSLSVLAQGDNGTGVQHLSLVECASGLSLFKGPTDQAIASQVAMQGLTAVPGESCLNAGLDRVHVHHAPHDPKAAPKCRLTFPPRYLPETRHHFSARLLAIC